jgi:hypothetical protein
MFLNQPFNLLLTIIVIFSSKIVYAGDLAYPMIKVPSLDNAFISTTIYNDDTKNSMTISLINPKKNIIKKARDIIYVTDNRKVIDEFFSVDNGNITLFVLTRNELDEKSGFKGVSYNIFLYDIYDNNIDLIIPPINAFMNCIDGVDLEKNSERICQYKTKKQILEYFKH